MKQKQKDKTMERWFEYTKDWLEEKKLLEKEDKIKLEFLKGMVDNYKEQIKVVTKQIIYNKLSLGKGIRDLEKKREKYKK